MVPSNSEIDDLLRQWRAVLSTSRPPWQDVDLTLTQLRALSVLAERQPARVGELAKAMDVSLGSASALADRLVRLGFLVRRSDPADRRSVLLHLHARGTRLLDGLERGSTERMSAAIKRMTAAERRALVITIRAFLRLSPAPPGLGSLRPAGRPRPRVGAGPSRSRE